MKIKKGFALRNIAGCEIVVPVGTASDSFNGMITLNDSAAFFWTLLQKETTVDEMVDKTLSEYEIDSATARKDIESFVATLRENNILDE